MIRESDIEIESFISLCKSKPNEGMFPLPIIDSEHKVARRVHGRLDTEISFTRMDMASGEEDTCVGIFEADLTEVFHRDNTEAARPDLV